MLGETKHIISVEAHNINGGLGSVVAEIMAEQGIVAKLVRLGIEDGGYAAAGDRPYTRKMLSIDSMGIVAVCQQLLQSEILNA
jgi:transketolase